MASSELKKAVYLRDRAVSRVRVPVILVRAHGQAHRGRGVEGGPENVHPESYAGVLRDEAPLNLPGAAAGALPAAKKHRIVRGRFKPNEKKVVIRQFTYSN